MDSASPIVCNMTAIGPAQLPRYRDLVQRLRSAMTTRRELSDGYVYALDSQSITVSEVDEWITMERRCCPFLTFEQGEGQLTMRGPAGTKAVLQEEFPEQ
jgi:hypothetical protein